MSDQEKLKSNHTIAHKLDGTVLTLQDLPPATWPPGAGQDNYRWTAEDRANVVAAINGGLISRENAFQRWRLSAEEYSTWVHAASDSGRSGLKAKRLRGVEYDQHGNPTRKVANERGELLKSGPFTLHPNDRRIMCGKNEEYLTPQEWAIFELFIQKRRHIVSLEEIGNTINSSSAVGTADIGRLDRKLSQISGNRKWIKNYRNQGWLYNGVAFLEE